MRSSENDNSLFTPFFPEFNGTNWTSTNSNSQHQHHPQERNIKFKKDNHVNSRDPFDNGLETPITSGNRPIYRPDSMFIENSQQNLIHHTEEDVTPPRETPPNNEEKTEIVTKICAQKKCFDDPDKKRKIADSILFCLFLIFVFGVFALLNVAWAYLSNKADTNLSPISGALSYIAFNLDSHPILDIKIQDDNIPCPENYNEMVLGTWPGTVDGCLCPSGLKRGSCDKTGDSAQDTNCDDISSTNPINMFGWGEDIWCVLRAKPGSEYKKAEKCSTGFRKCSPGICVLEDLNCPVTNIKKEGANFVAEIVEGESPVIDIKITPNNISCFGVETFASGAISPYILINEDEYGCSKYGLDDGYSFFLDSQKQNDLFYQNNFPNNVLNLLDYQYIYENTDAVLSYRKRLNIEEKDFCLNLDTGILEKASKMMDEMINFMAGTLIAGLIINSILCIWVGAWMIPVVCCCCTSLCKLLSKPNVNMFFGVSLVVGLMRNIDIIVMFGGMIYYRRRILGIKEYFVEVGGCFLDKKSESVVNDYQAFGNEVSWILLKFSIILFVVSTVTFFLSFYLFLKSRRRTL